MLSACPILADCNGGKGGCRPEAASLAGTATELLDAVPFNNAATCSTDVNATEYARISGDDV